VENVEAVTVFGRLRAISRPSVLGYGLLVTLLGLPLITPFLRWVSGPCTHDGHLHYHRLAAMRYALENGLLFSRWLPDVAFGYGYPFFLYREAVPLYISLLPHLLGLPLPAAVNLFYALSILCAGLFMFLWVKDIFGPTAGVVSAVAYMTAPYLLVDSLVRGNLPESLALASFPLLCWTGRRFMVSGTAASFLAATLGLAFLALGHNISILLFVPFMLIYLLAVGWLQHQDLRTSLLRLVLVMVLGLGLSAFYTLPALSELDEITISQSVTSRNNDFHFNFVTLDEILAPVSPSDPTLLNSPLLLRLGWVPILLAILGTISFAWTSSREQRGHIVLMATAAVGLLFMSTAASLLLWETLPLIEFVQFPWRFVGRAALPVAFLAGVPFGILPAAVGHKHKLERFAPVFVAGAVALLLLETLPSLYPHFCPQPARPTINKVHAYERNSGFVGVDPLGSYFPKTVLNRPGGSSLEQDYLAGRQPQRFDRAQLPDGAMIEEASYRSTSARIVLNSPVDFQARYLSFAFPGWTASVDGKQVPISPGVPEGMITFPVPAGRHLVEVRWGTTPTRNAAAIISLIAMAGLVGVSIALARRPMGGGNEKAAATAESTGQQRMPRKAFIILALFAVLFLLFKLLFVDQRASPFRREAPPPVAVPGDLTAAELHFEGYTLSGESVPAGEIFEIDLALRAKETPDLDYQSNVWLRGPDGQIWSDKETTRPRTFEETSPTSFWLPGHWAWDSREVSVLPGTPPGQYDIVMALFDLADLQPLTLVGAGGEVVGPTAAIGKMEVTRPDAPPDFDPQFPMTEKFSGMNLLGFSQDRQAAAPGELMLLTLFWERTDSSDAPFDVLTLELIDDAGDVAQSWLVPPARVDYPPGEWQAGERIRGQLGLRLAAGLGDGVHSFQLEGVSLGDLMVNAPQRLFEMPETETVLRARFGEEIELVGYSIHDAHAEAGDGENAVTVVLVWQGLAEMPVSYRAFVHLVDEDGRIVAQSDAEPAAWTRPTTGWAPGEYVVDEHLLLLPEDRAFGELATRVGLYDAATGRRLLSGESDHVLIPPQNEGG
jgi:hypothetical protein